MLNQLFFLAIGEPINYIALRKFWLILQLCWLGGFWYYIHASVQEKKLKDQYQYRILLISNGAD